MMEIQLGVKKRSYCAISSALDILGDKWSLLIIRDIAFNKKHTYGDLLNSDEKIATNILADRLATLEWAEIIIRRPFIDNKVKYNYVLTKKGIDLLPVLLDLIVWSDAYNDISEPARQMAKQIKKDRAGVLNYWTKELKKTLKEMVKLLI